MKKSQAPGWMSDSHGEAWTRAFGDMAPREEPSTERGLQQRVCNYVRKRYPGIRYESHLGGEKFSMGQAMKVKSLNSHNGYPDFHVIKKVGQYSGLFLELKKEGSSPYKKDGALRKDEHLESQHAYHLYLIDEGYWCQFATGYDEAIKVIDEYLKDVGQTNLF